MLPAKHQSPGRLEILKCSKVTGNKPIQEWSPVCESCFSMNMKMTPTRAGVVARSYRPTFQHTLNLLEHVTQLLQCHGPTQ